MRGVTKVARPEYGRHRKLSCRYLLVLVLCSYATSAPAQNLPTPFEGEYAGSKFPFSAKVTLALSRMGDYFRYTMRGSVSATFFKWTDVYDCSVMRVDGATFYPLEYVHRDTHTSRHDVQARFDWAHRSVRVTRGDGTVRELTGLPNVAWDPLSIQVRLRADVATADGGAERSYAIVEKDEVKQRRVSISGISAMHIDGLLLQVVKARTVGGKHYNEFWFAKNYAWLPIRVSMGGVTLDLVSSPKDAHRDVTPATGAAPGC